MKAKRITLIYPPTYDSQWGAIRPPIGLWLSFGNAAIVRIEHQILI
jgi:hypothetical protein